MVAADSLVVVGGVGAVKARDVHHAVVHSRVGQYDTVSLGYGYGCPGRELLGDETVVVEITLVDHEQVAEDEDPGHGGDKHPVETAADIEREAHEPDGENQQRP